MKKSKDVCDVKSCFLCSLCIKDWLPAVENNKKNLDYKKGELIFNEGDEVKGIYFIYKGKVKVHQKWGEDKELIIRFAKSGGIFGHRGIGKENHYPVSATALEPTTVCFIEKEFFLSSLRVNSNLMFELMMFYSNELQESEKRMKNLAHMSVKGRVASCLLSLMETFGLDGDQFLDATLSRQDIASFAGTTYETAFRVMNDLIAENAVNVVDKRIAIINAVHLQKIVEQESK
ncbi:Crp/Fnr family transcriptional regulator [Solitalea sp. MAHUQ-68]|uniref:Crp/Fnr family transcriptional regulator n=1 Tax=Solitalea agri TaxID=2953739 RepID=A0A9X2F4J4_9SPHI|nr:Crp/Fnr family transcriptional regulator [Solitalea agri]MCO4294105.1 Crp/Fnr family transcriptional regulator [Solitalea agri]